MHAPRIIDSRDGGPEDRLVKVLQPIMFTTSLADAGC